LETSLEISKDQIIVDIIQESDIGSKEGIQRTVITAVSVYNLGILLCGRPVCPGIAVSLTESARQLYSVILRSSLVTSQIVNLFAVYPSMMTPPALSLQLRL
jgi:hypothetical protein